MSDKYVYEDKLLTVKEISELSGKSTQMIEERIEAACVKAGARVSWLLRDPIIHSTERVKRRVRRTAKKVTEKPMKPVKVEPTYISEGNSYTVSELAAAYGVSELTVHRRLVRLKANPGDDVSIQFETPKEYSYSYTYKKKIYSLKDLAVKVKIPQRALIETLRECSAEDGDDVTKLFSSEHVCAKYKFGGEMLSVSEIAERLNVKRTRVYYSVQKCAGYVDDFKPVLLSFYYKPTDRYVFEDKWTTLSEIAKLCELTLDEVRAGLCRNKLTKKNVLSKAKIIAE